MIMSMIVRDEEDGHLVALSLHGPLEVACGVVPVLTASLAVWVSVPQWVGAQFVVASAAFVKPALSGA